MYLQLEELCDGYTQDFEVVFDTPTGPVDYYCDFHGVEDRKKLLAEMRAFYDEVNAGTKSVDDLVRVGLESLPPPKAGEAFDEESWDWFVEAMAYLQAKIAGG